ncbi:MAG TPA: response regulator transcription factor [Prevotella sp.]
MESGKTKILVVDDEQDLCEILKFNLENEGFLVDTAYSAEEALQRDLSPYRLMLLDVMMDRMSGFGMARKLREQPETAHIPIIFLTARDTENDRVTGFNLGADDYIAKPFSLREVVLRVKAVLRRTEQAQGKEENLLQYRTLCMDLDSKKVTVEGEEISLTKTEFELLQLLLSNIGKVFSRQELIAKIWPSDVLVLDRTVDVNITRMRKKVGPYAKNIVTRLGFGYYFER